MAAYKDYAARPKTELISSAIPLNGKKSEENVYDELDSSITSLRKSSARKGSDDHGSTLPPMS